MKKFGTPILAAPGSVSVYAGSLASGASACWSGWSSASGVGVGVAFSTLPVSDSVLPPDWLVGSSVCSLGVSVLDSDFVLPLFLFLPFVFVLPPAWFSGVGVAEAVGEGVAVIVGAIVAVGVGVVSVEPRSTIEAIAAGQARDLQLIDRRAGRNLDRDRQLLAGDKRHAHVVHLGLRRRHEDARVERGSGESDGERTA